MNMRRASVICAFALLLPLLATPASAYFVGNTTVDVSSSANPSQFGEFVTFTATVFSPLGVPSGTVVFNINNYELVSPPIPVTPTTGNYSAATYVDYQFSPYQTTGWAPVVATFTGSPANASSPTFYQYYASNHSYDTTTYLDAQPNPAVEGGSATFTAYVCDTYASFVPGVCNPGPSGVVRFFAKDSNQLLTLFDSVPMNSSVNASTVLTNLSVGNYTVCANFIGDDMYAFGPDGFKNSHTCETLVVEPSPSPSPSPSPTPLPVLSIGNVSMSEAGGSMLFTVTRTDGTGAVTFDYATSDGAASGTAATAHIDYQPRTGAGAIAEGGSGVFTLAVPIDNEALVENDEVFTVTISNIVGATMASNTAVGTILNDDALPMISIANKSVTEGDSGTTNLVFTVTRNVSSNLPVTFNWASAAGTATAGASCGAGVDFISGSSSGSIPASSGVATTTISVQVCGDTLVEGNENFTVTLSNVAGATVDGTGVATGTINENDTNRQVKVDQRSGSAAEGGSLTLTVSLNFVPGTTIAVNYTFKSLPQAGPPAIAAPTGGTACGAGVDYLYATNPTTGLRSQSGVLYFNVGDPTTQTVTIPTCADAVVDPGELMRFSLTQVTQLVAVYPQLNLGNQVFNGTIN